jgi:hypothetical protein
MSVITLYMISMGNFSSKIYMISVGKSVPGPGRSRSGRYCHKFSRTRERGGGGISGDCCFDMNPPFSRERGVGWGDFVFCVFSKTN